MFSCAVLNEIVAVLGDTQIWGLVLRCAVWWSIWENLPPYLPDCAPIHFSSTRKTKVVTRTSGDVATLWHLLCWAVALFAPGALQHLNIVKRDCCPHISKNLWCLAQHRFWSNSIDFAWMIWVESGVIHKIPLVFKGSLLNRNVEICRTSMILTACQRVRVVGMSEKRSQNKSFKIGGYL